MISMKELNIALFCDGYVGEKILKYMINNYKSHIKCIIVLDESSPILQLVNSKDLNKEIIIFNKNLNSNDVLNRLKNLEIDYFVLAWWPKILKKSLLEIPKNGTINCHPSLLPYCRGKNPNFWSIVENVIFGVTIHFVNEKIDEGEILFQKEIDKTWEDTGETLYNKSLQAMVQLFIENYPQIVSEDFISHKQDLSKGSFHLLKEMDKTCEIKLDNTYNARYLLNLLRARTFKPYPSCYFYEDGNKYEVRVEIKKIENYHEGDK